MIIAKTNIFKVRIPKSIFAGIKEEPAAEQQVLQPAHFVKLSSFIQRLIREKRRDSALVKCGDLYSLPNAGDQLKAAGVYQHEV